MLKGILKFAFAGAIIYWLMTSGKLDFSLIEKSFQLGNYWIYCVLLLATQNVGASLRWRLLLKVQSQKYLPPFEIIKLSWIGQFFSSVLPGVVTGDIIKLVYARQIDETLSKTFLVMSVLIDRILGLVGLLFLLGFSSVFYYNDLVSLSGEMKNLMHFNFILLSGAIAFVLTFFLPENIKELLLKLAASLPVIGTKAEKTIQQVWIFSENKIVIFKSIFISMILQSINIFAFWIITQPFYDNPLALKYVFTFIPLGFIAIAIPVSPAGLGVGHLIFGSLFAYAGISNGASLFNLYFLSFVTINLFGVIPYLLAGDKPSLSDTKQFSES